MLGNLIAALGTGAWIGVLAAVAVITLAAGAVAMLFGYKKYGSKSFRTRKRSNRRGKIYGSYNGFGRTVIVKNA